VNGYFVLSAVSGFGHTERVAAFSRLPLFLLDCPMSRLAAPRRLSSRFVPARHLRLASLGVFCVAVLISADARAQTALPDSPRVSGAFRLLAAQPAAKRQLFDD
jgi:hypothetical protein